MTNNFLTKQYVDHFLQAQIIQQLSASEKPLRFSDLKEDGIENSLFMYHANKLIDRGVVEKSDSGFRLTKKGAVWANYAGPNLLIREAQPKPLVQCVIKAKGSVLMASRTGSMKKLINEYLLPGGIHNFGKSADESINIFLNELFDEPMDKPELLTVAEVIITRGDELVHHTISHIFNLSMPEQHRPKNTDRFEYVWLDLSLVKKVNPDFNNSQLVPTIIENESQLKQHELFRL